MTNVDAPLTDMAARNRRGLVLMTCGFLAFSCADMLAKVLTAEFHAFQITWARFFGLMAAVLLMLAMKGPGILRTRKPGLQLFRGAIAVVSSLSFVVAVQHVPLAEAVAVSFIAPFIVTFLGAVLLREKVGPRRWAAITVGFLGVLIIIRPGAGVLHPAIAFVVLAATCFAVRQIVSRSLGNGEATVTTVAYTALTACALLLVPMVLVWKTPTDPLYIFCFALMAACAAIGELLIIRALEIAHAVVVAPMHYSLILFSTFWGFLVFGDLPDLFTWIGSAVVVASGLYTIYRESRHAPVVPPATPMV
ncbi:DMT family transporter [Mesobacterium pallidum]|uniref:DMT family transporter n=1 Tax=Mesobacterium pallidum TaxID=2872037 RepID=UPI002342D934|nr:DMT family transporter [Mesobacterium pallidum]